MILLAEPVGIKILETERSIEPFGGKVSFYHLQVSTGGPKLHGSVQKGLTDGAPDMSPAAVLADMDGIDADIIPVQDTQTGSDDLPLIPHRGSYGVFGNGSVHGGDNLSVNGIVRSF